MSRISADILLSSARSGGLPKAAVVVPPKVAAIATMRATSLDLNACVQDRPLWRASESCHWVG